MTDEHRIREAIVDLVDSYDVAPGAGLPERRVPHRPRTARRAPWLAGVAAAVVLVAATVTGPWLLLSGGSVLPGSSSGSGPVLPAHTPAYRMWRWAQDQRPLHRVAYTFRYHGDDELPPFDSSHLALVGDDLRTVRYLDGDESPQAIVSNDGLHLASSQGSAVRLEDLATNERIDVPIDGAAGNAFIQLLGWSADSARVYVRVDEDPAVWEVSTDGRVERSGLPVGPNPWAVTESPDGGMAVIGDHWGIRVVERGSGRTLVSVTLPGNWGNASAVWTPSGAHVVFPAREGLFDVIDARSGQISRVEVPGRCQPLVMLTEDRVLCDGPASTGSEDSSSGLSVIDLRVGTRTVVSTPRDQWFWSLFSTGGHFQLDVADDLARQWTFERNDPWRPPGQG